MSKVSGICIEVPTLAPLSLEDQKELIRKIRDGDEDAKIKLFGSLKGLIVRKLLMYYGIPYHQYDDGMAACYIGFGEACNRSDLRLKIMFSTYAFYWLKLEFFAWLKEKTLIQLPKERVNLIAKLESYLSKIPGNEQWPWNIGSKGIEAFCEEVGCSQRVVENILQSHRASDLNNISSGRKRVQRDFIDTVTPSSSSHSKEMLLEREKGFLLNRNNVLRHAMNKALTSKEKKILELYFGLDGERPLTQVEIGLEIGPVSKQYVSVVYKKGLKKLRDFFLENHPEFCHAI